PNMNVYYYNATTGYLYFNVVQDVHNPVGPSPLGSCPESGPNSKCPDTSKGETYYACPKYGCVDYTIQVNDPNYKPGPSPSWTVLPPATTDMLPAPTNQNKLVLSSATGEVITRKMYTDDQGVPYYTATNAPPCATTTDSK
ncbi:MAG: hypothetical protein ACRESR_10290, partial [Gammaproteobacteria bacterium]